MADFKISDLIATAQSFIEKFSVDKNHDNKINDRFGNDEVSVLLAGMRASDMSELLVDSGLALERDTNNPVTKSVEFMSRPENSEKKKEVLTDVIDKTEEEYNKVDESLNEIKQNFEDAVSELAKIKNGEIVDLAEFKKIVDNITENLEYFELSTGGYVGPFSMKVIKMEEFVMMTQDFIDKLENMSDEEKAQKVKDFAEKNFPNFSATVNDVENAREMFKETAATDKAFLEDMKNGVKPTSVKEIYENLTPLTRKKVFAEFGKAFWQATGIDGIEAGGKKVPDGQQYRENGRTYVNKDGVKWDVTNPANPVRVEE